VAAVPEPEGDVREYDPALAETVRAGESHDVVPVIARVTDVAALPPGVRLVTRFGDVVTLRVRRSQIAELAANKAVLAMEASQQVRPTIWTTPETDDSIGIGGGGDEPPPPSLAELGTTTRRPDGVIATGRGVVVGVLDWGCDFAHPAFRRADGSTRLLALWDQREATDPDSGNRWGYGRILTATEIDRALREADPYAALDYHPADADPPDASGGPGLGSHGTHVLDIAAGNGNGGGEMGVAPEAELVFCHLSSTVDVLGRGNLGDAANLLEALDWVFETAGDRPCVVNLSLGAHGGPHDGKTLVEEGIDRALWLKSGRFAVHSAGNYFSEGAHAQGRLHPGGEAELRLRVPEDDPTDNEIELWYSGADRLAITVTGPDGSELATLGPGADAALVVDGRAVGHVYHVRQTTNLDHQVDLFLRARAPGGTWTIGLRGDVVEDGRYHAWIERNRGPHPHFEGADAVGTSSTGTLANGRLSIAVGAYDPRDSEQRLGNFSSSGPTRDGRPKPELVGPGVGICAARSTPAGEAPDARYTSKTGTSMAAPHVTGTIALMCEAVRRLLEIDELRALLFASARRATFPEGGQVAVDLHRFGYGYLDIASAERAAREWAMNEPSGPIDEMVLADSFAAAPEGVAATEEEAMNEEPPVPSTSFRQTLWSLAESAPAWPGPDQLVDLAASALGLETDPRLVVVAGPATHLEHDVRPGDLVVRSSRSQGFHSTSVVVSQPELRGELALRGVPVEAGGKGLYVEVAEAPPEGGALRSVGRRLTDAWGRVPRGQTVLRAESVWQPGTPEDWAEDSADLCPWWMPEDKSTDYFSYAQKQTWGRADLLINGRSSGGAGPDEKLSEPFDMMQFAVETTNPEDSVYLASWMFDPETKLTRAPMVPKMTTWGDLIAAKANAGVTFRLLLNDFPALMKWGTNFKALDALILGLPPARRDNVKYVLSQHPAFVTVEKYEAALLAKMSGLPITAGDQHLAVHHQKFMVVRYADHMTTFCGGVDIIPGMTPVQWSKTPWHGWHDMQVRLEGPITRDLEKEFVLRWNRERGSSRRAPLAGWSGLEKLSLTPLTKAESTPFVYRTAMQMLRTVSTSKGNTLADFAATRRDDVRQAYKNGIACANSFLYLENQYYRTLEFADWIVARGKERPGLIVIIVVVDSKMAETDDGKNALTDHGFFLQFQTFDKIVKALGTDRVRFYEMHKRYVHSKLFIADDHWWCIGSANVNGRSFGLDSELNVQIREPEPEVLLGFRKRLWSHNLGVSEATVGGWSVSDFIAKWDAVADSNAKKSRDAMAGEGILKFDYTKFPGAKLPMVPDILANVGLPGGRAHGDRIA
jgi:phosphatidylserine/phosphatidylglycerophosphate/cardiolipin synthase-like enzyme/subtilisin family serine protease